MPMSSRTVATKGTSDLLDDLPKFDDLMHSISM